MRKKLIFVLILNLLCLLIYGQNWENVSLNKSVTVSFPSKPQVQDEFSNVTFYHIENSAYMINVKVSDINISTELRDDPDSLQSWYHKAIRTKLKTEQNGKLVTERKFELGKFTGLETDYITLSLSEVREVSITTRMIIIDNVLFVFDFIHLQPGHEKLKEMFMKSIVLK
jgi:hypothetical protein